MSEGDAARPNVVSAETDEGRSTRQAHGEAADTVGRSLAGTSDGFHVGPDADEIQISVFGPGAGESVLVHLGFDRWIIVDSCAEKRGGTPAAIDYLMRIGRDPAHVVDYVIATHWHDDHVHGFAEQVKACANAEVWVTPAVNINELSAMFFREGERLRGGTKELAWTMKTLRGNGTITNPDRVWYLAQENMAIHVPGRHPKEWKGAVWALAPSAADVLYSMREIHNLLEDVDAPSPRKVSAPNENHSSVVLHLQAGEQSILLTGDRVKTTATNRGWKSTVTAHKKRGLSRSTMVKIAHHGAPNGNSVPMWRDLLTETPAAVVAPYYRGNAGGRPRKADAQAILKWTSNAWITSTERPNAVERNEGAIDFDEVDDPDRPVLELAEPPLGHVRLRAPITGGAWQVNYGYPSGPLTALVI